MKKTMKKLLSLTLCVIMLMSVMGVQSFAAFDNFFKKPEVQSIALSADSRQNVSLQEIGNYIGDVDAILEEIKEDTDEEYTMETLPEDLMEEYFSFWLYESYYDYNYDITFTDGTKLTLDPDEYINLINSNYAIDVDGYITYDDYIYALENDKDTVEITYYAYVYGYTLFSEYEKEYEIASQIDAVDCVIKSITPVSGVPSVLYEECDYVPMQGAKLRIKYADGTTEIVEIEEIIGDYFDVSYKFEDEEIYVYDDWEGKLYIEYIDCVYTKNIRYTEHPFKKIEITNCNYDEKIGVTAIDFKITFKNGTIKNYSETFEEGAFVEIIDLMDGYYVFLAPSSWKDYEEIEDGKIGFFIGIADVESESVLFDAPEDEYEDEYTFFERIIAKIYEIIEFIKSFFENMFG